MENNEPRGWEKEWDEKFDVADDIPVGDSLYTYGAFKDFFRTLLHQRDAEIVAECERMRKEVLPHFPKDIGGIAEETARLEGILGYNQALTGIINYINKKV